MLNKICIKNFAIIDKLDINFSSGMTVLTGKTGAGKSIIVDALELVLGKRVTHDVIGQHGDYTDILAEFHIKKLPLIQTFLKAHDLESDDDCFIRRVIRKEGSKSYINNVPVTLKITQSLSELLINIHGQHEFQTLLKSDQQRNLLDQFAVSLSLVSSSASSFQAAENLVNGAADLVLQDDEVNYALLLDSLGDIYDQWLDCKQTFLRLTEKNQDAVARKEFLNYQIKELDELDLQEGEFEEMSELHQKLANSDLLLNHCREALLLLSENDVSVQDILNQVTHSMNAIQRFDDSLSNVSNLLGEAQICVQEASAELNAFLNQLDLDPEQFQSLEFRLSKIHDIARKHRVQPEALFQFYQDLKNQLLELDDSDERIKSLAEQLKFLETEYFSLAKKLTHSRVQAAQKLSQLVTQNIQQLGMPGGEFDILLETSDEPKRHGLEKVTFLVSANPGQSLQPLARVASGGELSRISLAIQVITAGATPILIFDEVDVGIGGAVAKIVGRLLQILSKKNQVVCITHLAQVASCGQHHFQVLKKQEDHRTRTFIQKLGYEERIYEIARMIGGTELTPEALAHAEQMLFNETHKEVNE